MTKELTSISDTREQNFTVEILDLIKIINSQKHKALILYLIAENEHPKQDLIQLLEDIASNGYLCLLWHPPSSEGIAAKENLETLHKNLILVHYGLSLIPVIKNLSAIVLSTQNISPDWSEALYHKFLWHHADTNSPDETSGDISDKADLISHFSTNEEIGEKFPSDSRSLSLKPGGGNLILWEEKLKANPKGWQAYANLNLQDKIAVMTATFLDFEGEYFYSGGAERYLLDLAEICEEFQRELVIFQYGNYPWMRRFKKIDIISLSRNGLKAEGWILKCAKEFNCIFYEHVQSRTALNIYSAFYGHLLLHRISGLVTVFLGITPIVILKMLLSFGS